MITTRMAIPKIIQGQEMLWTPVTNDSQANSLTTP